MVYHFPDAEGKDRVRFAARQVFALCSLLILTGRVPPFAACPQADIAEFRQKAKITIRGQDVPKPLLTFAEANFPRTPS